ncbi:DUF4845 domain-containing protein [Caldichromatium japonicum]|nr:DUF4845 domain-containing protein [Caldichromatium japonicum]
MTTEHLPARQRGLGFLSLIIIIALASFFGTLLFKLGPKYQGFWTVRSIMEETAKSFDPARDGGGRGLINTLEKRLYINSISHVDTKNFKVERLGDNRLKLILEYEDRVHLFFNIDAVLIFKHQVDVVSPQV